MTSENRIYLARKRALFLGSMPDLPLHRHAAAAMIFGGEGNIRVHGPDGQWRECNSVLIPPFSYHATSSGTQVMGVLFQEPGSEMFLRLSRSRAWIFEPDEFGSTLAALRGCAAAMSSRAVEQSTSEIGNILIGTVEEDASPQMDARILEIIHLIREDPEAAPGVEELGQRVGISGSRLIHLFSEETGTTLRRFRGWQRMKIAARELALGADLTTAAHAAGFFDSAHYSRAFKNMFGLPPSEIFRGDTKIIFPEQVVAQ